MTPRAVENTPVARKWRPTPVVLGVLLALGFGLWELPFASFMADDFIQLGVLERVLPVTWMGSFDLYTISDGNPQHVQSLKDAGALPWFFDPKFKMAFFRPLSSASLVLDHALFGLNPIGYRIHVALWFLVLVVGVANLYSLALHDAEFPHASTSRIATLALLIFTISGIHAIFSWTATRHIAIATALGLLALYSHLRWREQRWRPGRVWSVVGVALSLSASEAALGVIAYFFAYEGLGARGDRRSRVRAILPVAVFLVLYAIVYRLLGLGTSGAAATSIH
jgi:VanZ family protein